MAPAGGAYSRFVQTAKIILPLGALALFATLFLIAKTVDPDAAIPYSDVDVEEVAREARIGAPEFAGVTTDGTIISLSADMARPDQDQPGRIMAKGVDARFAIPDGSHIDAMAGGAAVDSVTKEVRLSGGIKIATSTGYRISASGLTAALGLTNIASEGPVTAEGPPGRIEAGQVTMSQSEGDPSAYVLVFNGGVKLIYQP